MLTPLLAVLALAPVVEAQTWADGAPPPLDAQLFQPSVDATATLGVDDAAIRDRGLFVRATHQLAVRPLTYTVSPGVDLPLLALVDEQDFSVAWGRGPVRLGLFLPLFPAVAGTEVGFGLGDLALDAKFRLRRPSDERINLALTGRLAFPTGTTGLSLSAYSTSGEVAVAADRQVGAVAVSANVGAVLQPTILLDNAVWGSQALARLGAGYPLTERTGLSLEASARITLLDPLNPASSPAEVLVGGWRVIGEEGLVMRYGVGTGLVDAIGSPRLRALMAFGYEPDRNQDRDLDGLVDRDDRCRRDPEDRDGWQDDDGCPEPTEVRVTVVDPVGAVLTTGHLFLLGEDHGSSARLHLDPGPWPARATAAGWEPNEVVLHVPPGPPVERTIPLQPVVVAAAPAAPLPLVVVRETHLDVVAAVDDSFYFDVDTATLRPESFPVLAEIARTLQEHPEIRRVRVEGHCDERGTEAHNLDLSRRRAEAVAAWLVAHGVETDRLETAGYGEARPRVQGTGEAAWSRNRRVDFLVVERAALPPAGQ